jgi:hypothetical protein
MMAQEILGAGVAQIMQRMEVEQRATSAQEIVLDKSNKVSFPGYPYVFEALGEKILISIDVFKSGYECKLCKGTGRIKRQCECVTCGHPGKKYSSEQIADIRIDLGDSVADARALMNCPECDGEPSVNESNAICEACKGHGALILLPDASKNLPTTGVVVSMGKEARAKADFGIGDRILFGPYAGNMIPTKAGLMFKYMDWNLGSIKIEGADDMAAFDFILQAE